MEQSINSYTQTQKQKLSKSESMKNISKLVLNLSNKGTYKKEEKFMDSVLFATESKKFLSYKEIINSDI